MTRDFYYFGRAFLGLATFCGLLQSIIFFYRGSDVRGVPVFPVWFLVASLVNVASLFFLLKYFLNKNYRAAFAAGVLVAASMLLQGLVVFLINLFLSYYLPVAYLLVSTSIMYCFTLLLSKARERFWLRAAAIILLLACILYTIIFILIRGESEVDTGGAVLKISQWASLIVSLVPATYILNFLEEEKLLNPEYVDGTSKGKFSESVVAIAFVASLIFSVVSGFKLATQSARHGIITLQAKKMSKLFEARTFVGRNGQAMSYRLLKPADYDSTKTYPLAVCLHGGAGWGTDNLKQFDGSLEAQILYTPENRKKYPSFIFVPQCAPGTSWGGVPGLRNVDSLVFEIITELEREFSIDTHRRYVMGHSLGGYGTWYFIGTRSQMFAGAIPSAGIGDPKFAKHIVDVPVWAFHGRLDRNVPVSGSRDIIQAVRQEGGSPRYTEYPDIGHGTWDPMKNDLEWLDWLFAQKRE
jgi:poly(3-hydroxybutyrate) depolymerase